MKIYKYNDFKKLPAGTVFSYYEPCYFRELNIKTSGKEWDVDFVMADIVGAIENKSSEDYSEKCQRMELGESVKMDFDYGGREGMFDEKQLYAVYERADVIKLVETLQDTLSNNK